MIKWVNSLEKLIAGRKHDLLDRRPGAMGAQDTKIIWVKMIDRPRVQPGYPQFPVQSMRNKFNSIIDSLVWARKGFYCMEINSPEGKHFSEGRINQFGSMQYWKEIVYNFKRFDRGETSLKPTINDKFNDRGDSKENKMKHLH